MVIDRDGTIYLALREGNALYRIDPKTRTLHHLAGTGEQGWTGDGGPARMAKLSGPKGLALSGRNLYVADTESHTIRRVNLDTGIITTVLGAGVRGDGPEIRSPAVQVVSTARALRGAGWHAVRHRQRSASHSGAEAVNDTCRVCCSSPSRLRFRTSRARSFSRQPRSPNRRRCASRSATGGRQVSVQFERRQPEGRNTTGQADAAELRAIRQARSFESSSGTMSPDATLRACGRIVSRRRDVAVR